MTEPAKMTCRELVERLTDYQEGALTPTERQSVETHLAACRGCATYLSQMQQTVETLHGLREEPIAENRRAELLQMFRSFAAAEAGPVSVEGKVAESSLANAKVPLGIAGQWVSPGDHLAYFWESEEEFDAGVDFLAVGLAAGDACFVFGYEEANAKVVELLRRRGIAIEPHAAAGRLTVVGGNASGDAMLANLGRLFQQSLDGGAPLVRLLGNLGWGRAHWPQDREILEFEAKVTDAIRNLPCVVVCMYDVASLPGRIVLRGGFETHPCTVRRKVLQENPHFVPAADFLAQLGREAGPSRVQ